MSTNNVSNTNTKKEPKSRISIWGEVSTLSVTMLIVLLVVVIACIVLYVLMNIPPKKSSYIVDNAKIFSAEEEEALTRQISDMSKTKDINVIILTTRDKGEGYTNSDEDCKAFVTDYYTKNIVDNPFRNHSGFCILVDLTRDYPGERFFWLYTYGTAHFSVGDDDVSRIFYSYREKLAAHNYYGAIEGILGELNGYSYQNQSIVVFFSIIIPAIAAALISLLGIRGKSLDPKPAYSRYLTSRNTNVNSNEKLVKTREIVYNDNDGGSFGSGGGFSGGSFGGGGGFSGGGFGGGGGFSGGGGGRF